MIHDRNLDTTPGQHGGNEQDAPRERDILDAIGEETAQMITPEHIENRLRETLRRVAFGRRDEGADLDLDVVCAPMGNVTDTSLPSFTGPDPDHAAETWEAVLRAQRDLRATRREAAQIITDARAAADKAHEEEDAALTNAAQIIRDAREQAQQIISDAEERAEQIIIDAHRESEQTQRAVREAAIQCWQPSPGRYEMEVKARRGKERQGSGSRMEFLLSKLTADYVIGGLLRETIAVVCFESLDEIVEMASRQRARAETLALLRSRIIHDSGQSSASHFSETLKLLLDAWQPDDIVMPAHIIQVKSSRPQLSRPQLQATSHRFRVVYEKISTQDLIAPATTLAVWKQEAFSDAGETSGALWWSDSGESAAHESAWRDSRQTDASHQAFTANPSPYSLAVETTLAWQRETAPPPPPEWIPLPGRTITAIASSAGHDYADILDSTHTYTDKGRFIIVGESKDVDTSHVPTPDVVYSIPDHDSEEEPQGYPVGPVTQQR